MTVERNADGLKRAYGRSQGSASKHAVGSPIARGEDLVLIAEIDGSELPAFGDGAASLDLVCQAGLPANAMITEAYLDVTEGFVSGGAATLDLGFIQEDGTLVDVDGLLSTIAIGDIDSEGERAAGNGALINGSKLGTISGNDKLNYLAVDVAVADITAGKGRLVVKYRLV